MGLRVYQDALELVRRVRPYRIAIAKEDPDQAAQLRRAAKSVPLQIAEADGSRGRNQQARFNGALGEARETLANLQVAVADGIIDEIDPELIELLDRIIGSLVKLSGAPRR